MLPITKTASTYNLRAKHDNRYRGFTIVELIVVVAVIGILAGVVLVSYGSWRTSVATASVKSDLQHAASAMESSRSFGNTYSATLPTTFTSSSGDTMTLTVTSATSFCIDGTSSNSSSIQYYIDNLTQATGPKIGTCATRTSALLPSVPTGLTVGLASTTSLSLTWTASSNATSYTAQCASDTAFIVGSQSTTVTDPTVTAVVTGLSSTTSYYCRVNATNASSTSAWSATVGPTTPNTAPPSANGGVVTTLAGSLTAGYIEGSGTSARFNGPNDVTVDASGNIYIPDYYNNAIRKLTPSGVVSTLAGSATAGTLNGSGASAQFNSPAGITIDTSGNLYVGDFLNCTIRKISSVNMVTTLAGSGAYSFADGTGLSAKFADPAGVAVDSSGNVYVADQDNNRIRKITPSGVVTTLAGSGTPAFANGSGTSAQFWRPTGIAVDTSGTVYVADESNNRIRKITSGGVVTTFAGTGTAGSLDGLAANAQFNNPTGVAVDSSGNVYVGDTSNNLIRKISTAGVVSTLAGSLTAGSVDGTGANARFNAPSGIAVDSSGAVYVADYNNNRIRKIQ